MDFWAMGSCGHYINAFTATEGRLVRKYLQEAPCTFCSPDETFRAHTLVGILIGGVVTPSWVENHNNLWPKE